VPRFEDLVLATISPKKDLKPAADELVTEAFVDDNPTAPFAAEEGYKATAWS